MNIDLMPIYIKELMRAIQKVGRCAAVGVLVLTTVLWLAGAFADLFAGVAVSAALLLLAAIFVTPGLLYDKVSQSTVRFTDDQMQILDKKGICWRTIDYRAITEVRTEEITGFFYGGNQHLFKYKYICVFLNGATKIPDVPFAKLFTEKDFIMMCDQPEAYQWLRQRCVSQPKA